MIAVSPTPEAILLLDWYDRHARKLPWRIGPGERLSGKQPDPYRIWLSEIMLQQTTVATVRRYFERFTALWPSVADLAEAPRDAVLAEWAGLGYYARARNLHLCAQAVVKLGGFPDTEAGLRSLPGVGTYTAAAIAAIAFDRPSVVVDGNVERVITRLFAIDTPLPESKPAIRGATATLSPANRPGCFAQAMMDLGATVCTPRSPTCSLCPWRGACRAHAIGIAAELPRKKAKPQRPTRHGVAFVVQRSDGAVLVERRPDNGLLGGMIGPVCTPWTETPPDADTLDTMAPIRARFTLAPMTARHVFTHFALELSVQVARVGAQAKPLRGTFLPAGEARRSAPTALRKALDIGLDDLKQRASR